MSQDVESLGVMRVSEAIGADELFYKEYKWEDEKWPKNSEFLMYVSSKEEPSRVNTTAQAGESRMMGQARRKGGEESSYFFSILLRMKCPFCLETRGYCCLLHCVGTERKRQRDEEWLEGKELEWERCLFSVVILGRSEDVWQGACDWAMTS